MKILLSIFLLLSATLYADINTTKKAMNEYKKGNIKKAVKLLTKSCNDGTLDACVNLGYIYIRGLTIKKDFSKGYDLLKNACEKGNNKGCVVLGNGLIEEENNLWYNFELSKKPTSKDILEHNKRVNIGITYLSKACENGLAMGCSSLGGYYWNFVQQNGGTKKLPQIQKKAINTLKKACDLKDVRTCMQLAYSFENIGEKYFSEATKLYKKACDFKYKKACSDYKRLHEAGY